MDFSKFNTQCEACDQNYHLNLTGITTQYIKYTCKSCQKLNVIENPAHTGRQAHQIPDSNIKEHKSLFKTVAKPLSLSLSIRTKITLVLVLLVLISVSVVGLFASTSSRHSLVAQAESTLSVNTIQKSKEYALSFKRIQHEVETIARFAKILYERPNGDLTLDVSEHILMPWTGQGYGNAEINKQLKSEILTVQHLAPFLKSIVNTHPLAQAGYLGTATRIMIMDNPEAIISIGQRKGYENTKRPWYIKAAKEGKTIWSEPYIDAITDDIILTCATPVVLSDGKLAGVAAYDVSLSTIQQDILTLNIGYQGYAMLVDSTGKALVRPGMQKGDTRWDKTYETDDLLKTGNASFNQVVNHMVAGRTGVETFDTEEGQKLMAYAPLPDIGASMAIVVGKNDVIAPAQRLQNVILTIWGIVLVVAIVIGFVIGNGITRPINELTEVADRISQGEMDLETLAEDRKDEIGRLTQAFNRLITSLKIAMSVR